MQRRLVRSCDTTLGGRSVVTAADRTSRRSHRPSTSTRRSVVRRPGMDRPSRTATSAPIARTVSPNVLTRPARVSDPCSALSSRWWSFTGMVRSPAPGTGSVTRTSGSGAPWRIDAPKTTRFDGTTMVARLRMPTAGGTHAPMCVFTSGTPKISTSSLAVDAIRILRRSSSAACRRRERIARTQQSSTCGGSTEAGSARINSNTSQRAWPSSKCGNQPTLRTGARLPDFSSGRTTRYPRSGTTPARQ